MPLLATNIVELFPSCGTKRPTTTLHREQMDQDIRALAELADRLQQMKAPFREASDALVSATVSCRDQIDINNITSLGENITSLEAGISALILAMTMYKYMANIQRLA